jgi:hypothetical protein
MKKFETLGGAYKYAENSSRKHNAYRYVIKCLSVWFVRDSSDLDDGEILEATFCNGEKI